MTWPCSPPILLPGPEQVVARYADRWSLETSNATGKQVLGVGQARNRVARAVERTVPFEFLTQNLVTYWYSITGRSKRRPATH
ncbi:hypothetical protein [Intrasporangium sp.]|uniref:hypothetical protein n=1 Tax=Intrasporangium sp. TaxID=1925024 RepID=UPI0032214762